MNDDTAQDHGPVTSPLPQKKFQHRYAWPVSLFLLTLLTTSVAGGIYVGRAEPNWTSFLAGGLPYSIAILLILGAHEFGHYWLCRIHNVDATLPYFLPAPLPLTGTLGAVIRIREPFPNTRALFDIGVAGPIAGFVMLLPFLVWGVAHSTTGVVAPNSDAIYFGEPLLFQLVEYWQFGNLPPGVDTFLHPVGFAAWFGMLATALNLLPFGQLDGGHIAYAAFGHRARFVSMATLAATVLLTLRSSSWIVTAILMLLMAYLLGFQHPRVLDEREPLDRGRRMVALVAFVIFVICFTPVPIETLFQGQ